MPRSNGACGIFVGVLPLVPVLEVDALKLVHAPTKNS